jgi:anthranilate synthase component 1
MLVDLSDLSRNGHTVTVDKYRKYSFLPCDSFESPDIYKKASTMQVVADTFQQEH